MRRIAVVLLAALCLAQLVVATDGSAAHAPPSVNLCQEYHGYAGEESGTFHLNTQNWVPTGNQRYVLYARGLSPDASVQLIVAGKQLAPNEPYMTNTLPAGPLEVKVERRTLDASPFTFISFIANSEDCRLPLDASNLAVPLPVVDGAPATVYFYSKPVAPFTFFNALISAPGPVVAAYRLDASASPDSAVPIPVHTPTGGIVPSVASNVYFAARAPGPETIDAVRFSVVWSIPPANFVPPRPLGPKGGDNNGEAERGGESDRGHPFFAFVLLLVLAFVIYMAVRSVYNYRVRGITTYPQYVPHHEVFQAGADHAINAAEVVRGKVASTHIAGAGPFHFGADTPGDKSASGGFSGGLGSQRRGYESVGGSQP